MNQTTKKYLVVGAVLLALVGGVTTAFAATAAQTNANAAYCGVGVGQMLGAGNSMMNDVSKSTGLSFTEIQSARISGKSLAQLLTEKGKDVKAFISQEVAARKTSLDQLVSVGRITKDQADLALKNFQQNIEANVNRTTTGPNGQRGAGVGGMMNGAGGRGMGRWSR